MTHNVNKKRLKLLDPKTVGLRPGLKIGKGEDNKFYLILDRKSRIIMKDGFRIQKQSDAILTVYPGASVSIITNAPVCSKTRVFLEKQGITVYALDQR